MLSGIGILITRSVYSKVDSLDFLTWITHYDGPDPYIGRANYHHTLGVF